MKGIMLYLISIVLSFIVKPMTLVIKLARFFVSTYNNIRHCIIVFSWKKLDNEFLLKAIANDKFCNHRDAALLTKLFLTKDSKHAFGNPNETISSVLGKNLLDKTLTEQGYEICALLDDIQPNHVIISVDNSVW